MDGGLRSPPIGGPSFSDRRATGNRYRRQASTSSAQTAEIFASSRQGRAGSPDRRSGRRGVYQSGPIETIPAARRPGGLLNGRDPQYELRFASGFPAVSPDGRQIAVSERTGRGSPDDRTSLVVWNTDGTNPRRIFHAEGSLM